MLRSFAWFLKNKTYSDIRQYSAVGPVQQAYVAAQKRKLQKRMNKHFRVKIFQPKSGGGDCIDGNKCRLVFSRPEAFGHLIGFPPDLIRDFYSLILALTSGVDVNPFEFQEQANSWLDRFHGNPDISWNILSPTVHMVLHHGAEILAAFDVPPGLLSEEGKKSLFRFD